MVDLVTRDVVHTMTEATLNAVAGHGASLPAAFTARTPSWRKFGIEHRDVIPGLEDAGVARFDASWGGSGWETRSRPPGSEHTEPRSQGQLSHVAHELAMVVKVQG